jgi:hypothetical protein
LISDCGLGAALGGGWCREELDQEQRKPGGSDARKHSGRRQLEFKPNWVVI